MLKKECRHCVCLVEADNNEWVCDEVDKPIKLLLSCPESED